MASAQGFAPRWSVPDSARRSQAGPAPRSAGAHTRSAPDRPEESHPTELQLSPAGRRAIADSWLSSFADGTHRAQDVSGPGRFAVSLFVTPVARKLRDARFPPKHKTAQTSPRRRARQRKSLFTHYVKTISGWVKFESIPIPLVKPPRRTLGLPAWRNPDGTRAGRHFPMSRQPLILIVAPGPVAGNPDVIGRRPGCRHLLLQRRRSLHHDDRTLPDWTRHSDGSGWVGHDCGRRSGIDRALRHSARRRRWWRRHERGRRFRGASGKQADRATGHKQRNRRRPKSVGASGNICFHTQRQTLVSLLGSPGNGPPAGAEYPMGNTALHHPGTG
jgi:hypothetical protein